MTTREKNPPVYKNSVFSSDIVKYMQDSGAKSPVYEREYVTHGVNCKCKCTSVEQSNRFQDEYRKKIAETRKVEGKSWRQKEKAKAFLASVSASTVEAKLASAVEKGEKEFSGSSDDWSPYPTEEDFEK